MDLGKIGERRYRIKKNKALINVSGRKCIPDGITKKYVTELKMLDINTFRPKLRTQYL